MRYFITEEMANLSALDFWIFKGSVKDKMSMRATYFVRVLSLFEKLYDKILFSLSHQSLKSGSFWLYFLTKLLVWTVESTVKIRNCCEEYSYNLAIFLHYISSVDLLVRKNCSYCFWSSPELLLILFDDSALKHLRQE